MRRRWIIRSLFLSLLLLCLGGWGWSYANHIPLIGYAHTDSRDGRACSETNLPLLVPFLPVEADRLARVDIVMYTHAEDDHFGRLTPLALEAAHKPTFLGPPPVLERLREMGVPP